MTREEAVARNALCYCAYCGHEVWPDEDASKISEHVAVCPKHPMRVPERACVEMARALKKYGSQIGDLFGHDDEFRHAREWVFLVAEQVEARTHVS